MRKIISQWYFDLGEGMSEETSLSTEYEIDPAGMTKQTIVVPAGCKYLRWDPCDSPCMLVDAEFKKDNKQLLIPRPQNGFIDENVIVFNNDDPQVLLDFDGEPDIESTLTIIANIHFVADRYLLSECEKIMSRNNKLTDEIKRIKKSRTLKNHLKKARKKMLKREDDENIIEDQLDHNESSEAIQEPDVDESNANVAARRILRSIMIPPQEYGLFVPYRDHDIQFAKGDVKPIAYYLPQFHSIPENDEWWGKGFTEWTNVVKSLPRFEGHYQPHLPYDVGFYDLSGTNAMKRQIELAKNYGIFGFCFYYYWFAGKRLLEKPVDNFLGSPGELDFPFCLCWANENWTRRWDGDNAEILIGQSYSDADDLNIIADLSRYFADDRYIRIDGKPFIMIYRGDLLPDVKKTIQIWKEYCVKNGIGDIVVAGNNAFEIDDPVSLGFDFGIEFPPHGINVSPDVRVSTLPPPISEYVYFDMDMFIENIESGVHENKDMLKGVFVNWDNSPRRQNKPNIYPLTPEQYQIWLSKCLEVTKRIQKPEQRFVFINAWNEWAEGAHLEPDQRYGYAYLEATAEALKND